MSFDEETADASAAVTAAEAELKAAQEKLAAAKIRLSEASEGEQNGVEENDVEQGSAESTPEPLVAKVPLGGSDWVPSSAEVPSDPSVEGPQEAGSAAWQPAETNVPPAPSAQEQPAYGTSQPASGAVPPQQPHYGYQQPYHQQPYAAQPVTSTKDHVAAGLLAIFLGWLGIHKFYLGYNTSGFIMLAVTVIGSLLTFGLAGGVVGVISIIEGILYLTKSQSEFEQIYVFGKREWF